MKISASLAQKIVENLKITLHHKVNFMDMDGFIIASSDQSRINTFHEGAALVIKTKKALFIDFDGQYKGTKKGINMPIYFDSNMIGVVGLTGGREVEKYAQILKAMTEILVKEAYLSAISLQKREKQRLIIESLLLYPTNLLEEHLFELDLQAPYRVIVGSGKAMEEQTGALLFLLESFFLGQADVFFTISRSYIILLIPDRALEETLKKLQAKAFSRHRLKLNFGVGLVGVGQKNIRHSFETAKRALSLLQLKKQSSCISYFENLDLDMLLSNIPQDVRQLFLTNVLRNLPKKEWQSMQHLLTTFSKHNGSINKCAEELFIHKNTVQYKLNKIKTLTGYDPRNYQDFAVLYFASSLLDVE